MWTWVVGLSQRRCKLLVKSVRRLLTFTLAKRAAVQLYEKLGFHTIKSFNAVVGPLMPMWRPPFYAKRNRRAAAMVSTTKAP
jgi:hypothetical protein